MATEVHPSGKLKPLNEQPTIMHHIMQNQPACLGTCSSQLGMIRRAWHASFQTCMVTVLRLLARETAETGGAPAWICGGLARKHGSV